MKRKLQYLGIVLLLLAGLSGCSRGEEELLTLNINSKKTDCLKMKCALTDRERSLTGIRLRQLCELLNGLTLVPVPDCKPCTEGGYYLEFCFAGKSYNSIVILEDATVLIDGQVYRTKNKLDYNIINRFEAALELQDF